MTLILKIFSSAMVLCVVAYTVGLLISVKNIDEFCGDINISTSVNDIAGLAKKHNVSLSETRQYRDMPIRFVIDAASYLSANQYACRVYTDGFYVTSKSLGSN